MTPVDLLAHATRFTFPLKPGVDLIVAQTQHGYTAWRNFAHEVDAQGGHIIPAEVMTEGRYLNRNGTYGWPGQNGDNDLDFYFNSVEDVLIAAGDTFVTLTAEQVKQLQTKEPQPCQT